MIDKTDAQTEAERREVEVLYRAIGQFVFEFSQLEFMIRNALGDALDIPDNGNNKKFDIVTSPYDFATLCNVTKAAYVRLSDRSDEDKEEVESILNAAMDLNSKERVPIAHGTWFISAEGFGARHVSRNKLELTIRYSKIPEIDAAAQKAATLRKRLVDFIIAPFM